ncbi:MULTISPECIES: F0F1 ATP synthase subunit epsilon [Staphylococcus]|jgi:F-type H+-transporting ATPase subunit epsilon|uniref:ATP synthase epsilon chain n=3 Tax=Staphylococcus cohnii species complex TaxID=3239053 RepID=A0A2T4LTQ1_9STAP|nr:MULTISPECIES: F0F1 ATP synthase subunit epsilon [Staphylococcus]TGP60647.1 F0F1 ATP synthase subunit epsilon [bacterium M00.F.Ca.ET.229.01.1.1]TGS37597.1 F0F1 ATP synthase subunit epsilon [bacterium M00.F.Ca.ET.180.01.1.1]AQM41489.1 F0F1 ATP synthase subunit epsilon [Staphylococcus cohnii]AVL77754.1 F0F1 ATP synthase subunit epsilon [Staphylococcus cohnii]AYX90346.1 F0F1 ATP synthase subunit epsilon [Staphylococcus cohnii]
MNTLSLNIVTPNGSVYDREDVTLAVLQTTAGEIGVMYGHIPTVAALEIGYAKINFDGGSEYIAVSEGFVEVRQDKLSIIVQTAEPANEIDVARAELAKSRAESHLNNEEDSSDINRAKRALDRANNRLRVAQLQ